MKYIFSVFFFLLFFMLPYCGFAEESSLSPSYTISVPESCNIGDPFVISATGKAIKKVTFTWMGKEIELIPGKNGQKEGTCEAIFAVPLNSKKNMIPAIVSLTFDNETLTKTYPIQVLLKKFPEQRLQVKQKYVTPPPDVQKRIAKERKILRKTFATYSDVKYWTYPFMRPIKGQVTSLYGLRRFFNGQEKNPHKGVDFDAKKGEPAHACDAGVVVLTGDFYYNGNTVVVDHGLGVFTYYLHLSKILVKKGQQISRGDIVGLVGSTGRVTGPHLHLGLSILGGSYNAAKLIEGMKE